MDLGPFPVEIQIPNNISPADSAALQRCVGKVVFLSALHHHVPLAAVAASGYSTNGVVPDILGLMAEYRKRFPAVIDRVVSTKITAYALNVGHLPRGPFLQNTGPFDLCNGDPVSLVPPMCDSELTRLALPSAGLELIFPMTVPQPLAHDLMARALAVAAGTLGDNDTIGNPRGLDILTYNGRSHQLQLGTLNRDTSSDAMRGLLLHALFGITEGTLLLMSLLPTLLVGGLQDGYLNALLRLGSATREAGELLTLHLPAAPQDGNRRFVVKDAFQSWLSFAAQLGNVLGTPAIARVCTYDGPSTLPPGERVPIVAFTA